MDVYCPKCGEPCDTGEFLYMEEQWGQKIDPDEARRRFFKLGCGLLFSNGEKFCGDEMDKKKAILSEKRLRRGNIDIFIKANGNIKDEAIVQHPIESKDVPMEDLRIESWSLSESIQDLEQLIYKASASEALHDLLGDDLDGIASMLD